MLEENLSTLVNKTDLETSRKGLNKNFVMIFYCRYCYFRVPPIRIRIVWKFSGSRIRIRNTDLPPAECPYAGQMVLMAARGHRF